MQSKQPCRDRRWQKIIHVFFLAVALTILGHIAPVFGKDELTIYPVKYRTAEELVKVAEPIFFGRATFSFLNEKIVISAPQKTADAVLKLFKEIDRRPRMYGVEVRLVSKAVVEAEARALEIEMANRRAKFSKKSGVASGRGKSTVAVGGLVASMESVSAESSSRADHSIEVLEGKQAVLLQGSTFFPGGFAVKVRGAGSGRVTIELNQREGSANPAIALSTEMNFSLGKWHAVGRVSEAKQNSRSEILGESSGQSDSSKVIQVRVLAR